MQRAVAGATGRRRRRRSLPWAALVLVLVGCTETAEDNPYDPVSDGTVPGEVRLALILPPIDDGDELGRSRELAEALRDVRLVARPVGAEPGTDGHLPLERPDDVRLAPGPEGQRSLERTLRLPFGEYVVDIDHRLGLFERESRRVSIALARRSSRVEVHLRRARLGVLAEFDYGDDPPPADAWFELRGLDREGDDCVREGHPIRRFDISGVTELRRVVGEAPAVARPLRPWLCGLVGGPGFQVFARALPTPIHPSADSPEAPLVERAIFRDAFRPDPARARVYVFGRPEARVIDARNAVEAGEGVRSERGEARVGSRLALLRIRLDGLLRFGGDGPPENRVRRIAVLDARSASASIEQGRFVSLDDLPTSDDGLPYLGGVDPDACRAADPASETFVELLGQANALRTLIRDLAESSTVERLLPYCLGGGGPLHVLLEVEDGTVHTFETTVVIDRLPIPTVSVSVIEDRPALGEAPAVPRRVVPAWRGRFPVHAASRVSLAIQAFDSTADLDTVWRVTADVVSGELRDGGWNLPECRSAVDVLVGADRLPAAGRVGELLEVPVRGLRPPPEDGAGGDAFRVQRNRVCLFIEDDVGTLRRQVVDVDVIDGRLEATLRAGASAEEGDPRWLRTECVWPEQDRCFEQLADVHLINDRIVFQTRVEEESVDPSIHGDHGLRALFVRVGEDESLPLPFVQGRYMSHRFDSDGLFQLRVYGRDLLDRVVPFEYAGEPVVRFARDTHPPRTRGLGFLTCHRCALRAPACEVGNVDIDPCQGCIEDDFVLDDGSLMAAPDAPVPIRFDFDFPDSAESALCAVLRDVTAGERTQIDRVCGRSAVVHFGARGDLTPDEEVPGAAASPPISEEGRRLQFRADIIDAACNGDRPIDALMVHFDARPPRLGTTGDEAIGGVPRATDIRCRRLVERCDAAGRPSCWQVSRIGGAECASGPGEPLLEDIDFTVLDPASAGFDPPDAPALPTIRHRLILSREPLEEIPEEPVCGEAPWGRLDDEARARRTAGCPAQAGCRCLVPDTRVDLGFRWRQFPAAYYDGSDLLPITLGRYRDISPPEPDEAGLRVDIRVLSGVRPYLALEDAVGNPTVVPLIDRSCLAPDAPAGCAERTYTVPIRPSPDDTIGELPAWQERHACVTNADGEVELGQGTSQPDEPEALFCRP